MAKCGVVEIGGKLEFGFDVGVAGTDVIDVAGVVGVGDRSGFHSFVGV